MNALKAMFGMIRAEWTKLWRRGFATAGLVIALIHALLVFLIQFGVHAVQKWGSSRNEGMPTDLFDGIQTGEWCLFALYLPVMVVVVMAVVGELFAGEYAQRTYSLLLLRPVARWQVFTAKFLASYGYLMAILIVAILLSSVLGLAAFGTSRTLMTAGAAGLPLNVGLEQSFGIRLGEICVEYLAIIYSWLPIVAATAFLAVVTRSTALTVTYTIILLIIDAGIWLTFPWVTNALEYPIFAEIKPYTLMAARIFWFEYFFGSGEMTVGEMLKQSWQSIALVAGYSALFIGGAIAVFTYQDVE